MRSPGQKKISWSDLLAVRRPPSQASMRAPSRTPQPVAAVTATKAAPPKKAPTLTGSAAEAAALVRRAEQALQHKDIAGAVKLSLRARTMDANVPHVNAFAAWVSVLGGEARAAEAIGELDKIIAQHDDCVPARLYRAKLLKRDDRMPEAMRELEVVLQLDPDNRDAQNELKLLMLTIKPTR
jgi:tetratricopeptide (TPR) repeat protein